MKIIPCGDGMRSPEEGLQRAPGERQRVREILTELEKAHNDIADLTPTRAVMVTLSTLEQAIAYFSYYVATERQ